MNVIIVEDEIVSSRRLERLLLPYNCTVLERLNSVKQVLSWFKLNEEPDLMFLDIHLSDGLCFEVFDKLTIKCPILFTTAYNTYSLKAFDYNSLSYLLKPIRKDDLDKAIKKADSYIANQKELQQLKEMVAVENVKSYKSTFAVKTGTQIKLIKAESICFAYTQDNCSFFKTLNDDFVINESLNVLEVQLNEMEFFRVNRSVIVNKLHIDSITNYSNNRFEIHIKSTDETIIVSRNKSKAFKTWFTE